MPDDFLAEITAKSYSIVNRTPSIQYQFPNSPVHFHDWKIPQCSVRVGAFVDHGMGEEGITSRDPPNMEQMRE